MEAGVQLGGYEIVEPIGAGGMGEVYRARDARLARDVAIKVLPADLAADPERLARLQQEARLLASLDHPNVAAVYGLEEASGTHFVVMQLAAGETLASRIAAGPLPVSDAVDIAGQLAEGLEAAHETGVIHRDLKPANIMVSEGGDVKILDFGLAKSLAPAPVDTQTELTASPTMMAMTSAGMILGTAAYMSPEQARGKPLDRRTDIWSFGAVLYEMLTGAKAFDGETVTDVLAAIITREPDWDRLPAGLPAHLTTLLRRCLDKDPRGRLRDIGEARVTLAAGAAMPADPRMPPDTSAGHPSGFAWLLAGALAALAAFLGWRLWTGDSAAGIVPSYVAVPAPQVRYGADYDGGQVAVSPDGRALAIVGYTGDTTGVWIRRLDEPAGIRLEGVAGWEPAWSPDGQMLALIDAHELLVHDLRSGATSVRYRSDGQVESPAWAASGELYFGERLAGRIRINEALPGGDTRRVTELVRTHTAGGLLLHPLGDDRFLVSQWEPAHGHVHTSIAHPGGRIDEPLLHLDSAVQLAPPDILLYARDGSLWAQRLDVDAGVLAGEPVALLARVDTAPGTTPWLSVGDNTLSYRVGVGTATPTVLEFVDRQGNLVQAVGEAANYYDPRMAPDGRRFVYDLSTSGDAGDIWLASRDGAGSRLTSDPADETRPVWSSDGTRVVLETTREDGPNRLFVRSVNEAGETLRPIGTTAEVMEPTDWAGTTIVANGSDMSRIWVVDSETGASRPYRETTFMDYGAALAPDGSHVVYVSDESGREEIWVDTFPEPSSRRRVSTAGGLMPLWRRDGAEIVYYDYTGVLVSVPVLSLDPLELGEPTELFKVTLRRHEIRQFDAAPDGAVFLVNRLVDIPNLPISLLVGWREVLAERVPEGW